MKTKTKTLALINGIVGLVGGIFLLFSGFLLLGSIASDISTSIARNTTHVSSTSTTSTFILLVQITLIVLGIVALNYYKDDKRISSAPHILLIVGGGVSLIPFLGFAGNIVAIVGGSLYLAALKKFNEKN